MIEIEVALASAIVLSTNIEIYSIDIGSTVDGCTVICPPTSRGHREVVLRRTRAGKRHQHWCCSVIGISCSVCSCNVCRTCVIYIKHSCSARLKIKSFTSCTGIPVKDPIETQLLTYHHAIDNWSACI